MAEHLLALVEWVVNLVDTAYEALQGTSRRTKILGGALLLFLFLGPSIVIFVLLTKIAE